MEPDNQEDDLREGRAALDSMLIPGETVIALAFQRRLFAISHRRILVAATSGRLLAISRGLIGGFSPIDLRWQDLKHVAIEVGVFGSDLSVTGLALADLAMDRSMATLKFEGLRKDDAQALYRVCQAQEQAWREKRRVRELEELRAQSGGFHISADPDRAVMSDGANMGSSLSRLQQAKDMFDKGLISDSEYETIKARVVGQI
jgi:hypothetical protein